MSKNDTNKSTTTTGGDKDEAAPKYRYTGPAYNTGIWFKDRFLPDPENMTAERIAFLIEQDSDFKKLFRMK